MKRNLTVDLRGLSFSSVTGTGHGRLTIVKEQGESDEAALARVLAKRLVPSTEVQAGVEPQHLPRST